MTSHRQGVIRTAVIAAATVLALTSSHSQNSHAAPEKKLNESQNQIALAARDKKEAAGRRLALQGASASSGSRGHRKSPTEVWQKKRDEISAANAAERARYARCVETNPDAIVCGRPRVVGLPTRPDADGVVRQPLGLSLPPEEVAYQAAVSLVLTPPRPVIGPPPSINPWKIAAVGYPLWLSVSGDRDPAPVSATAYDLTVRLDARLSKVVFAMGDGKSVTCTDLSRAWRRGIEPGTPSPTCGYTYEKVPRSGKRNTVTATSYWAVDWQVNGEQGTIPFVQRSSTRLPVGELQVVVR